MARTMRLLLPVVGATDAGECAVRCARGFNKGLGVSFRSLGGAIGDDALFETLRVSTIADVAGIVDRRRNLGRGEQRFRYLHVRNYTDKRLRNS